MKSRHAKRCISGTSIREVTISSAVGGTALLFAVARSAGVGVYRSDGGDIATWIFVHEWMSRGSLVYRDVWEHKDIGFLILTQPFYSFGSTIGLYSSGVLAALMLAIGVYCGVRSCLPKVAAFRLSSLALTVYVLSPTFLSVYKESYAIAFGVLAVSVARKRPVLAGALIGISTTIKVSGMGIFVMIVVAIGVESLMHRQLLGGVMRKLGRLTLGYLGILGLVSAWAYRRGVLGSWMEVVRYNVEYSSSRREAFDAVADVYGLLALLSPGYDTVLYLGSLVGVGVMVSYMHLRDRQLLVMVNAKARQNREFDSALFQGGALVVATLIAIVSQTPPRFQHYTYLIGAVIYVCALLAGQLLVARSRKSARRTSSLVLATALLLGCGLTQSIRADGVAWPISNIKRWTQLDTIEHPLTELGALPKKARVAFVNLGGTRVNLDDLDATVELSCRFFFHYPNLIQRYGRQMLDCLTDGADYIVLGTKAEMSEDFTSDLYRVLRSRYSQCESSQDLFEIWTKPDTRCPQ